MICPNCRSPNVSVARPYQTANKQVEAKAECPYCETKWVIRYVPVATLDVEYKKPA